MLLRCCSFDTKVQPFSNDVISLSICNSDYVRPSKQPSYSGNLMSI